APSQPDKTESAEGKNDNNRSISISANTDKPVEPRDPQADPKAKDNPVVETETIRGKNGTTITRTTMKDGTVNVQRKSSHGKMVIDMNNFYDMAGATRDAVHLVE